MTNPENDTHGETYTLDGCSDCLVWVANADDSGMTDERAAEVVTGVTEWNDAGYYLVPEGKERGFSMTKCEVCKSPLGGDRFEMYAIERGTP